MQSTTTTALSMVRRRRFNAMTTSSPLLVGFVVLLAIAVAPRSCDAVSPWKNAEDKLREQGLLHGDTTPLPEEEDDGSGGGTGDVTGEGGAASGVGEDGKPRKVSPAEASYKEAKKLLSDFDSKARRKAKAFALLKTAIKLDPKHRGALLLMGRAYQMGEGVDADEEQAVRYFETAAELGDPGAHEELGFVYSVGWGGKPKNTAKAVLHQYFAATGGDERGQMAMAYRHLHGIGVPKSCQAAVLYYNQPAEKVINLVQVPGLSPNVEKVRLTTDEENGASARRERDVVQYYQYSADMGNADAATAIGQLLNYGARGMTQDHRRAYRYFTQAAAAGDTDAMSHLGHMHANGLGVKPNNETALSLFKKAAEKGHAHAQYGLGYMYLAGYGVTQNYKKALHYFNLAAEQGSAEAQFHLGALQIRGIAVKRDYTKAFYNFNLAAHQGHVMATYNLAMMQLAGLGLPVSCKNAATLLKGVAERGPWNRRVETGHSAYQSKSYPQALVRYMKAAEMGLEVAQSNAAYMLEQGQAWYESPDRLQRVLYYHRLAADQGNVKSLLQIGDAYYYGKGAAVDRSKSAAVYLQASSHRSAQAMFNLGMMHEHGIGLPKDLHLAKRYYDMVLSTDPKASVPIKLALWKLNIHGWLTQHEDQILRYVQALNSHEDLIAALVLACALAAVLMARLLVFLVGVLDN